MLATRLYGNYFDKFVYSRQRDINPKILCQLTVFCLQERNGEADKETKRR